MPSALHFRQPSDEGQWEEEQESLGDEEQVHYAGITYQTEHFTDTLQAQRPQGGSSFDGLRPKANTRTMQARERLLSQTRKRRAHSMVNPSSGK